MDISTILIIGVTAVLIFLVFINLFRKRYIARRRCSVMVSAEITGRVAITSNRLSLKVVYFYMENNYRSVTADWINDSDEYDIGKIITIWIDPDNPSLCIIKAL